MKQLLTTIAVGAALAGCADDPVAPSGGVPMGLKTLAPRAAQSCSAPKMAPVLEFDVGAAEGLAVDRNGDVFVGNINTGEIWRAPKGQFTSASRLVDLIAVDAPLSFLLGMATDAQGNLYAAVNALLDQAVHGVWRVGPDGNATRVAALPAFFASLPNDVALDERGNVYVSDSFGGAIWRLTPDGALEIWVKHDLLRGGIHPIFGVEFGVNGIAYSQGSVYAGIHLNGRVIRIPVERDGNAGMPTIVIADERLIGNDGLELDASGNIYVANNFANTVQRIGRQDLAIETILAEQLSAPASIGLSNDARTIYVANLSTSAPDPRPPAPAVVQGTFVHSLVGVGPVCE